MRVASSIDIAFHLTYGNPGELCKLAQGHKLMRLLLVTLPDFTQQGMPIALTSSGDNLHVFGVYDTAFFDHGSPPFSLI